MYSESTSEAMAEEIDTVSEQGALRTPLFLSQVFLKGFSVLNISVTRFFFLLHLIAWFFINYCVWCAGTDNEESLAESAQIRTPTPILAPKFITKIKDTRTAKGSQAIFECVVPDSKGVVCKWSVLISDHWFPSFNTNNN